MSYERTAGGNLTAKPAKPNHTRSADFAESLDDWRIRRRLWLPNRVSTVGYCMSRHYIAGANWTVVHNEEAQERQRCGVTAGHAAAMS